MIKATHINLTTGREARFDWFDADTSVHHWTFTEGDTKETIGEGDFVAVKPS